MLHKCNKKLKLSQNTRFYNQSSASACPYQITKAGGQVEVLFCPECWSWPEQGNCICVPSTAAPSQRWFLTARPPLTLTAWLLLFGRVLRQIQLPRQSWLVLGNVAGSQSSRETCCLFPTQSPNKESWCSWAQLAFPGYLTPPSSCLGISEISTETKKQPTCLLSSSGGMSI